MAFNGRHITTMQINSLDIHTNTHAPDTHIEIYVRDTECKSDKR